MASQDLQREARKIWSDYGETIAKAFNFPSGSLIVADGLDESLKKASDEVAKAFIEYTRGQMEELRTTKYLGER